MVKRFLSLTIAVLMALACFSIPAAAAEPLEPSTELYFEDGLEFTWMRVETSQQKMAIDAPVIKYIKEKLNVTINLQPIPEADYETKRKTVLASNTMPDVMDRLTNEEVGKYGGIGMFYNLSEHVDKMPNYYALVTAPDRNLESNKFLVDGNMYSFRILEYNRVPVAPAGVIRVDLLEEQNIPMPTTWAELYDAMLKIKEKHPDMYAFSQRQANNGTNNLIGQFAYPLGTGGFPTFNRTRGMYYEPEQDAYIYGPTSENFTAVVEFMRNAYADGLLDPDYAATTQDQVFEKLSNNKLFFHYDNNSHAARVFNPALAEIDPNYRFDLLPPLENSFGGTRALAYERDWGNHLVINSQNPDADKIMQVIDWFFSEEGMMITNFGVEGIDYDLVDGVPVMQDWIIEKTTGASDHFMAIQGELGVGLHGMGRYIDEATYKQVSDPLMIEMGERIAGWIGDGLVQHLPNWPPFTEEETERIVDLEIALGNIFDQEIDAFITGARSMDEWPVLVESLKNAGVAELEEIFNTANDRVR